MMKRRELWAAMTAASDALMAASVPFQLKRTPATQAKMEAATWAWVERLIPLIGQSVAFEYEGTYRAFLKAVERKERFSAALAVSPDVDEADRAWNRQLRQEMSDAMAALERVSAATMAALDEAKARDR